MYLKGERVSPKEDRTYLCAGIVMEDEEMSFTSRPNAVYVLCDDSFYPRYFDAMDFDHERK